MIILFIAFSVLAQTPEQLRAQVDRYARAEKRAADARTDAYLRQENARFQASGGRVPLGAGLRNALEGALRISGEGAYLQFPRAKGGGFKRGENFVLITASGVYCFQTGMGFTRATYACYQPGGAPYASFEHRYE